MATSDAVTRPSAGTGDPAGARVRPIIRAPLETSVLVLAYPPEPALRVLRLEDRMVTGRLGYGGATEPGAIQLFDQHATSGRNTRFVREESGTVVLDMGHAPTFVNGERVRRHLLRVGDQVQAGYSLFRFEHTVVDEPWPEGARPFLAAILRNPGDDGARSVLADWLSERGDPRGEFISLQLAHNDSARARADALLAQHELAWVAPLPVPVESWTFERGFLSSVRVRDVGSAEALRAHHPLAVIEPIPWERVVGRTTEPVPQPRGAPEE